MKRAGDIMSVENEMFELFLEESSEQIENIEEGILKLEQGEDEETIKEIFRMAHSLKGSSSTMGFMTMSEFTHDVENLLDKIKTKALPISEEIIALLFESLDKIKEIKDNIAETQNDGVDTAEIREKLAAIIGKKFASKKPNKNALESFNVSEYDFLVMDDAVKKGENVFIVKVEIAEDAGMRSMKAFLIMNNLKNMGQTLRVWPEDYDTADDSTFGFDFKFIIITIKTNEEIEKVVLEAGEIKKCTIEKFEGQEIESKNTIDVKVSNVAKDNSTFRNEKRSTIRVDITKLDKLIGLVGELVIDKERLLQLSDRLRLKYKSDPDVQDLLVTMPHIDFIGTELQEAVMAVRMYTVENVFSRFPRMVRDLATKSGKSVNFVTEGEDTELDRGLIEEIVDPLVHLLRNSVDHGIETVEERTAKGKDPQGTVTLKARQEENNVVIEVVDDGKGIDVEAITAKALEKGILDEESVEKLTQHDKLNLIFVPGFSTAKVVTDVSGRGVGMDVVKTNIEKLNGVIEIETEKDKGSKFIIKLPLTLAIIQALLIHEGKIKFAIPLSSVIETIRLKEEDIEGKIKKVKGKEVYIWRDQVVPVIRLGKYFKIKNEADGQKVFLIVVGFSDRRICFAVEGLIGEQQIVIKSLGEYLGRGKLFGDIKGISGATILGDGSFAYITDIPGILKEIKHEDVHNEQKEDNEEEKSKKKGKK